MKIIECEQGTPEWFSARLGKVTASRIADVVAKTKSSKDKEKPVYAAYRANYAAELVVERMTGTTAERFKSAEMIWGSEKEPDARASYEFITGATVATVGLVEHPAMSMACASPDGLVGDDGLVEIKCPNTATHIDTLLNNSIADRYVKQMHWQMICTGRQWCDFVSFDPRMPGDMQLFIQRVPYDEALARELETEAWKFLAEVNDTIEKLNTKYRQEAAE